ncbi:translation initiation factor Sui1 [Aquabacterium sp.]|uniref:translation initiation factor Sui1 n=1 Tax=Aquabacterium sp. TaxID=1872578 RepID=UPI002C6A52AA|nr:translation initiation factor Sui1 [Aquabacterium sp.]HSW08400.1 translation initiation factor Sui1 [Aquabacterium sp.]
MALVYSTDSGRICPACGQPKAACVCKQAAPRPAGDGVVRVSRETQSRRGKAVTVVRGVPLDDVALAELAKRLKALCGAGGSVKDGIIEVQGEHLDKVMAYLRDQGWTVKRAGG